MRTLFEAADESGDGFIASWLFKRESHAGLLMSAVVEIRSNRTYLGATWAASPLVLGAGTCENPLTEDRSEFVEIMTIPEVRREELFSASVRVRRCQMGQSSHLT